MNTGLSADGSKSASIAYGIWGAYIREALVHGNLVTYSDPNGRPTTAEDRAFLMSGYIEAHVMWTPTLGTASRATKTFAGCCAPAVPQRIVRSNPDMR